MLRRRIGGPTGPQACGLALGPSASFPPIRLPPTMPRPKRTSSQVTDEAE
ncbi:hypothetical protein SBADM41S_05547 [Streptomyces badius]